MNTVVQDNEVVVMPRSVELAQPTAANLIEVTEMERVAQAFQIINADSAELAADELKSVAEKEKLIEAERTKIVKPLNDAVKATNDFFRKLSGPVQRAGVVYRQKLIAYQQAEEKRRREEQERAEKVTRDEKARLEREAKDLAAAGKKEEAAAKRDIAEILPTPVLAPTPNPGGFGTRKNWKARTTGNQWRLEMIAFIAGVPVEKLAHPQYAELLDLNQSKANHHAKALEKADLGIPGLEGFNDPVGTIR